MLVTLVPGALTLSSCLSRHICSIHLYTCIHTTKYKKINQVGARQQPENGHRCMTQVFGCHYDEQIRDVEDGRERETEWFICCKKRWQNRKHNDVEGQDDVSGLCCYDVSGHVISWPVLPVRTMSGSMVLGKLGPVLMFMAHVTHQMSCRCHSLDCFLKPRWYLRALLTRLHLSLTLGEQVLPLAGSHRQWGGEEMALPLA